MWLLPISPFDKVYFVCEPLVNKEEMIPEKAFSTMYYKNWT